MSTGYIYWLLKVSLLHATVRVRRYYLFSLYLSKYATTVCVTCVVPVTVTQSCVREYNSHFLRIVSPMSRERERKRDSQIDGHVLIVGREIRVRRGSWGDRGRGRAGRRLQRGGSVRRQM